jgi:hypothetical protein
MQGAGNSSTAGGIFTASTRAPAVILIESLQCKANREEWFPHITQKTCIGGIYESGKKWRRREGTFHG